MTYARSTTYCVGVGASLCSLASIEENKYIVEQLNANAQTSAWIGLTNQTTAASSQLRWLDGLPVTFLAFNQPIVVNPTDSVAVTASTQGWLATPKSDSIYLPACCSRFTCNSTERYLQFQNGSMMCVPKTVCNTTVEYEVPRTSSTTSDRRCARRFFF
jgi:hypothetical protein